MCTRALIVVEKFRKVRVTLSKVDRAVFIINACRSREDKEKSARLQVAAGKCKATRVAASFPVCKVRRENIYDPWRRALTKRRMKFFSFFLFLNRPRADVCFTLFYNRSMIRHLEIFVMLTKSTTRLPRT